MGTITKRPSKRGPRYRAEIRIKRGGDIVHREAKSFSTKSAARNWMERREAALGERDTFERYTVADAIGEYRERFEKIQNWGVSKSSTLAYLEKTIGHWDSAALTVNKLVSHVSERRLTVSASTAGNDLIWLAVVFKALRPLGRDVALQAVQDATTYCRSANLIGRAKSRTRRPTAAELTALEDHFERKAGMMAIPMKDIVEFAYNSARRQSEITRIRWEDDDESTLTGLVRDAKHPRMKEGNHQRFKYTRRGWEIRCAQPRVSEFIFPYNHRSVGSAFTKACKFLEIEDLRFHDLRHEATSRLFETGYSIIEVQQFTLHEDINVLMRYTHLRPGDIKLRE